MRTQEETIAHLREHASPTSPRWREDAEWRRANRSWLRQSQMIAMKMLDAMEEQHLTQRQLAERMGCSQQYVSKVLKGRENLSIETISKIEDTLALSILFPTFA